MPDLAARSDETEIMDNLSCAGAVVDQTLRELEVINRWLGGNQVTINALDHLLQQQRPLQAQPLIIADLGCGGGDMLRLIYRWAVRRGITVTLVGIDANPHIIEFARENLRDVPGVTLLAEDVFSAAFKTMRFDVVIGTLFYHHFTQQQLTGLFSDLKKQTRLGLVVNDIHRHPMAYHSIKLLTKLFSRSAMVKYDAPLSVRRAFSRNELAEIFRAAGLPTAVIRWRWAFRWQVVVPLQGNFPKTKNPG